MGIRGGVGGVFGSESDSRSDSVGGQQFSLNGLLCSAKVSSVSVVQLRCDHDRHLSQNTEYCVLAMFFVQILHGHFLRGPGFSSIPALSNRVLRSTAGVMYSAG